MTSFLLACVAASNLSKPVTLRVGICSLEQALPALSQKVGVSLKAKGPAATEVVFLDLKAFPLDQAMKSIAEVTGAEWVPGSDGSFTLERTPNKVAEAEEAERKEREETLKGWVAYQMNPSLPKPVVNDLTNPNAVRSASRKAVAMFVSAVGAEKLASLDSYTTHAFVEKPNSYQESLPADAKTILTTAYGGTNERLEDILPPEVILLEVRRQRDHYEFALFAVNPQSREERRIDLFAVDLPRNEVPKLYLRMGKPTPDDEAMFALEDGDRRGLTQIERYYEDPVRNDPIRLFAQSELEHLSKIQSRSIVANCPDGIRYFKGTIGGNWLSAPKNPVREQVGGDVIEWRPFSLVDHWRTRVDRRKLAAWIKRSRTDWLRTPGYSAFCLDYARLSDGGESYRDSAPLDLIRWLNVPHGRPAKHDDPAFRDLLVSLDEMQIARLQRFESIPYPELTTRQQRLYRRAWLERSLSSRRHSGTFATFDLGGASLDDAKLKSRIGHTEYRDVFKGQAKTASETFRVTETYNGITGTTGTTGTTSGGVDPRDRERYTIKEEVLRTWEVEDYSVSYFLLVCALDESSANSMEGGVHDPVRRVTKSRSKLIDQLEEERELTVQRLGLGLLDTARLFRKRIKASSR